MLLIFRQDFQKLLWKLSCPFFFGRCPLCYLTSAVWFVMVKWKCYLFILGFHQIRQTNSLIDLLCYMMSFGFCSQTEPTLGAVIQFAWKQWPFKGPCPPLKQPLPRIEICCLIHIDRHNSSAVTDVCEVLDSLQSKAVHGEPPDGSSRSAVTGTHIHSLLSREGSPSCSYFPSPWRSHFYFMLRA